ncbi:MAG TPA: hypothetical protein VK668_20555 [Mucilaginibacter sp.]|nr:hypothetical protein [Mucilaginibacter sp.]
MKKHLLLLSLILFSLNSVNAKSGSLPDSLKMLQRQNIEFSEELSKLRNEIEYTKSLVQVGNGSISNQLSSSQHNLSSLSNLFTVISIILVIVIPIVSWYITRLSNRVTNNLVQANTILSNINNVRQEVLDMQTEVTSIQQTIRSNLSALYESLRNEEIKAIFKRLEVEPLDINHFFPTLATVTLSSEYFDNLIKILNATKDFDNKKKAIILILLCSHFPSETLNNQDAIDVLKDLSVTQGLYMTELIPYLKELCECARNNQFEKYLPLIVMAIFGTINSTMAEKSANATLNIFNEGLSINHKKLLIAALGEHEYLLKQLDALLPWENFLKINN